MADVAHWVENNNWDKFQKELEGLSTEEIKRRINAPRGSAETPLMVAAKMGLLRFVKKLVALGADINVQDDSGWSPLYLAVRSRKHDVARCLLQQGASVNLYDNSNRSAFIIAAMLNDTKLMALLLKAGADINHQDNLGLSAAHFVCFRENQAAFYWLLEHKADFWVKDTFSRTPIDIVKKQGWQLGISLLKQNSEYREAWIIPIDSSHLNTHQKRGQCYFFENTTLTPHEYNMTCFVKDFTPSFEKQKQLGTMISQDWEQPRENKTRCCQLIIFRGKKTRNQCCF